MKFSSSIITVLAVAGASVVSAADEEFPTCTVNAVFSIGSETFEASDADKEYATTALKSAFNIAHGGKKVAANGVTMKDFVTGPCGWLCDDDGWSGGNGITSTVTAEIEVGGPCGWLCDDDGWSGGNGLTAADIRAALADTPKKSASFEQAWCETLTANGGAFSNVQGCQIHLDCAEPEPEVAENACNVFAQYDTPKNAVEPTKAEMTYAALSLKSSYNALHEKEGSALVSAAADNWGVKGPCGWLCDDDGWSGGNGLASKLRGNQEKTGALEFSVEVGGPCGWLCDDDGWSGGNGLAADKFDAKYHAQWEKNLCRTLSANGGSFEGVKNCKVELQCNIGPPSKKAEFVEQAYEALSKVAGKNH